MNIGDTVKRADADRPPVIEAYRALRGEIVNLSRCGIWVAVQWDIDTPGNPTQHRRERLAVAND